MRQTQVFWKTVPFVRMLIPFAGGIVLAGYFSIPTPLLLATATGACLALLAFRFLSRGKQFVWRWVQGLVIYLLLGVLGCATLHYRSLLQQPQWAGHSINSGRLFRIVLNDAPVPTSRACKTTAAIEAVYERGTWKPVEGKLLVYFAKDSLVPTYTYGTTLVVSQKPQRITHNGNPGGFDFAEYCSLQDIYHQVYLQPGDYLLMSDRHTRFLPRILLGARNNVLALFRKWVPGTREAGVAEALLIGYRNDLDKDLVAAYSRTGVVHIIAISGLHLGMIYGLMILLLKPLRRYRWIQWAKPVCILLVLWGFSLLAGAAASILRSVVMFSFIVTGESLGRRTNVYNTLAASAFCLLVYDPRYLQDVGFQLSYTAVLGIVLFSKPIYRWLYFRNRLLDSVWELNSITLAAQVLTLPLILFYFHQFPNLFLFTNFVAVPASGFILYGELALLVVGTIPTINAFMGGVIGFLLKQMNTLIERTDRLPFASSGPISLDVVQTILLYSIIACTAWWLLRRTPPALLTTAALVMLFFVYGMITALNIRQRDRLVVYNIPRHSAMDRLRGRDCVFYGDSALFLNTAWEKQYLSPSRTFYRVREKTKLCANGTFVLQGARKCVLVVGAGFEPVIPENKIRVDLIILTQNTNLRIPQLAAIFNCTQYVFDNSNPLWKIRYWKKDADNLHLRHHTLSEQGAFETDL